MKKIIIPLILIVAVLAFAPFFIGSQAENKIREMYAKASEYPNIKFEITEYNQGWFSSDVKIKLNLDVAGVPQGDEDSFSITQKMQHGPLLWKSGGLGFGLVDILYGVEFPKEVQTEMDQMEGLKSNPVLVVTRLSFDGSSVSFVNISPFTLNKNGNEIIIKEGKFEANINMNGKVTFVGSWQGMQVKEDDHTLVEMGTLSINIDQSLADGQMFTKTALYEGDFTFDIDKLNIIGHSPADTFKFENVFIGSTSAFNQDLANITAKFGAKKISAMEQEFEDFIYDFAFENINKETILAMNNIILENGDPDAIMNAYQDLLPGLIEKNPALKLNLGVKTSVGQISTTAAIAIDKEVYSKDDPMSLMLAVDATASGYAPESFFSGFGMESDIEMMIMQNMLIKDNDQIKFDVSFKKGQLILNGAPMPMGF